MKIKKSLLPICLVVAALVATMLVACGNSSYTVTFDPNYTGATTTTQTVASGEKATRPETDPAQAGNAFMGWFTAPTGGSEFDFSTAISADTTIYAQWAEAFAITVNLNYEGAAAGPVVYVPKNNQGAASYVPEAPTREGFAFGGWFSDEACKTAFQFARKVTADTTVYVSWKKQLVMEAELTDLTGLRGPGFSGTASATEMIAWDEGGKLKASNEFYVAYLYAENLTLTFNFNSDTAVSDADIVVRMSAEFYTQTFSSDNYTVSLNGSAITGWTSPQFVGSDNPEFVDVAIMTNRTLNVGPNTITLTTTNTTSPGGTMQSQAPMIDCVKVASAATLTWVPKDSNFGPDGFPKT